MLYSRFYFKKKTKIHNAFYILITVLLLLSFIVLYIKQPKKSIILKNKLVRFEIVNLSAQQAGIFWETKTEEYAWVNVFSIESGITQKYMEDTNIVNKNIKSKLHYVFIPQLKSNSKFKVNIENEKGIYLDSNNKEFILNTPPILSRPVFMSPLYGKVMQLNGTPSIGSFVLINIDNAYPLLTTTKDSGEWLIPLSSLVSKKTNKYFDIDNNMKLDAFFFDNKSSTFITSTLRQFVILSQSIFIGKTYSVTENNNVLSATSSLSTNDDALQTVSILYPRENALIPALKPLIKGKGIVDVDVYAYINSKPQYSFRTKVDSEGYWMISPQEPLQPGNYVLSLNTKDEKGNRVNLMRHFIISKSGEQVLGTATAEPTITIPAPQPTAISPTQIVPTKAPTILPIIPSNTITPTPIYTAYISPTLVPTQVTGVYATVVPTPPTSGQNETLYFAFSLILLISGSLLLFIF